MQASNNALNGDKDFESQKALRRLAWNLAWAGSNGAFEWAEFESNKVSIVAGVQKRQDMALIMDLAVVSLRCFVHQFEATCTDLWRLEEKTLERFPDIGLLKCFKALSPCCFPFGIAYKHFGYDMIEKILDFYGTPLSAYDFEDVIMLWRNGAKTSRHIFNEPKRWLRRHVDISSLNFFDYVLI
ncbi:hypothetical protein GOP47_0021482 [Adiantum capillus-veneris]|uniref:Uncharacterized protein n=1 Tax=Adiantum capillus-veneris TaxID=13818 RepID=A0A9D4Z6K3_ADICA|nr:hypothetical protein GOP47_0021482 [Adiantum capillus-veneris]